MAQEEKQRHFPIVIKHCPQSLKFMVQFYRNFSFSFSGVLFEGDTPLRNAPLKSVLLIGSNTVSFLFSLFMCFVFVRIGLRGTTPNANLSPNSTDNFLLYQLTYGPQKFFASFDHFKPIVRTIIRSLLYVFSFNYIFIYPFSLLKGGPLLRQIVQIPNIRAIDTSKSFAINLILLSLGTHFLLSFIGFLLFSRQRLFRWLFSATPLDAREQFLLKQSIFISLATPLYTIVESMVSFIFIYVMYIFRRNIQMHSASIASGEEANQQQLLRLKMHLFRLSKHFQGIIGRMSLELTVIHFVNVYLLVTSPVYFMVQADRYESYSAFIFCLGAIGLLRVFIICWASSWPSGEYKQLKLKLYESRVNWSNDEWICLSEIRRLKKKFRISIWSTYTISNSSILTMLSFALNYIVVMLQTENYAEDQVES